MMGTDPLLSSVEKRKTLRRLELEAYASVVTAFRAQGPLTETKKSALELLCNHFCISPGRHRAEVRRAVNDDLLSSIGDDSPCLSVWERQWRKEGQKLAPSNARFTSRPTNHLSQVLTNTTLATHFTKLNKAPPKSTFVGIKPRETSTKPQTEKKAPSQRVQNVLKYIIAQRPHGSFAKAPQSGPITIPRKAQSAPPTPVKKPPVDKKVAQIVTTSSQLAKALSPLKALVMGKSNVPQISTKSKGSETKKITPKSMESAKNNPDIAQQPQTSKSDGLNTDTPEESFTNVSPAKNPEPEPLQTQEEKSVEEDHNATEKNSEQPNATVYTSNTPSQVETKGDESNPTGPLVVKFKGLAPTTQAERVIVTPTAVDSTLKLNAQVDTQKAMDTAVPAPVTPTTTPSTTDTVHTPTIPTSPDHSAMDAAVPAPVTTTTDIDHTLIIPTSLDHSAMDTEDHTPLPIASSVNRKRPAISDPPSPVKKRALSPTVANVEVIEHTPLVQAFVPTPQIISRESLILPSLSENTSKTLPIEGTPTVDADKLLQSLSTDSYNLEESELASELGVDPSLLDFTGFMGIIQPEGVSIPGTPTTPLSLVLPFASLPPVDQLTPCAQFNEPPLETSRADSVTSHAVVVDLPKQATTDQPDNELAAASSQMETNYAADTFPMTPSEVLTTSKSEVVQLTSKDFDILREIEMNEDNILEGIPQELAATIQAIANIEEGDTVPWNQ